MPIDIVCKGCSATLRAPVTAAGKKIKCPKCATIADVPADAKENAPRAVPPPPPPVVAQSRPPVVARAAPPIEEEVPRRWRDGSPRRGYDDDDNYDRFRRRRGPRRDAHETEPGTGLQLGLGIGSTSVGALALCFAIIP